MTVRFETEAALIDLYVEEGTLPGSKFGLLDTMNDLEDRGVSAPLRSERAVATAFRRMEGWGLVFRTEAKGRNAGWCLECVATEYVQEVVGYAEAMQWADIDDASWEVFASEAEAFAGGRKFSRFVVRQAGYELAGGSSAVRSQCQQIAIVPSAREAAGLRRETLEEVAERDDAFVVAVRRGDRKEALRLVKQYLIADMAPLSGVTLE